MKNFQQNLLIVLAIALCGLCVYQWYGQTVQRRQIQTLNQTVYDKSLAIRDYTNSIATMNHQIDQMSDEIMALKTSVKTNEEIVTSQKRQIEQLQYANDVMTNQVAQYKQTESTLENKLKEAYDGIKKQNASIKELVSQRDELVKKYNDSVKDRNDIVSKYNELAGQVKKMQSGESRQ